MHARREGVHATSHQLVCTRLPRTNPPTNQWVASGAAPACMWFAPRVPCKDGMQATGPKENRKDRSHSHSAVCQGAENAVSATGPAASPSGSHLARRTVGSHIPEKIIRVLIPYNDRELQPCPFHRCAWAAELALLVLNDNNTEHLAHTESLTLLASIGPECIKDCSQGQD